MINILFFSSIHFISVFVFCSFHLSPVNFTTITVSYTFQRRLGYYVLQVYIPDILIVLLSWIAFWMNPDSPGDRLTIGITTILTIMFLSGAVNASMPPVSYAKAVDWYLIISFAFIFLSVIESLVAYVMSSRPVNKDCSFDKNSTVSENDNDDDEGNESDNGGDVDVVDAVFCCCIFFRFRPNSPWLRILYYLRGKVCQKAILVYQGQVVRCPMKGQTFV